MSGGERLVLDRISIERGGRLVVRDVSLEVERGAVTALLGPNGAGKSSLVLAVGGLLRVQSGSIAVGDEILSGRRPERIRTSGVAIVPEGRRLLPELTTLDNLRVATYALAPADARSGIAYALELFPELKPLLGQVARTLSGGQQQMVVLAQALVSRPRFLLIDELSLGLAPVVVQRLVATVRDVAAAGVGILLVEQFTSVALGLARRAYILEGGEVRFDGTAEALRADPDVLQSVYLLRGRELTGTARPAGS
jgi:branched-chain amino acid transport system ATP-binding protein